MDCINELPCPLAFCWDLPVEGTDRCSEVGIELVCSFIPMASSLQSHGLSVAVCYRQNVWVPQK